MSHFDDYWVFFFARRCLGTLMIVLVASDFSKMRWFCRFSRFLSREATTPPITRPAGREGMIVKVGKNNNVLWNKHNWSERSSFDLYYHCCTTTTVWEFGLFSCYLRSRASRFFIDLQSWYVPDLQFSNLILVLLFSLAWMDLVWNRISWWIISCQIKNRFPYFGSCSK